MMYNISAYNTNQEKVWSATNMTFNQIKEMVRDCPYAVVIESIPEKKTGFTKTNKLDEATLREINKVRERSKRRVPQDLKFTVNRTKFSKFIEYVAPPLAFILVSFVIALCVVGFFNEQ